MENKKPDPSIILESGRSKPIQDVIVSKQAINFPNIGMTLSSYKKEPQVSPKLLKMTNPLPHHRRKFSNLFGGFPFKKVIIFLLIIGVLTGGWVGGKFLYNTQKLFGGNIFTVLKTTKLQGESNGRVNILLAGNSSDDVGHEGAPLTDSIMIVSLDTINKKMFLLSIPRDLWVNVPGYGHQKINAAYVDGQNYGFNETGYPAGGMGQLQQVIEQNLGITINYYALVNYAAFKDAVDAVGGIDVTIASSDKRGLYDPNIDWTTRGPLVKLSNGVQHLTGQQALNLSRARGDGYRSYGFPKSDFDRTQNQRLMLVALKSKVVTIGVITNPSKLSKLSDAIGNNVTTNINISEVRRFYDLVKAIDGSNIQSLSLNDANGKNLLANYTSSMGELALRPAAGLDDFSAIQAFMAQHTSSNPVVQEGATVVVLNATDTAGLATKARTTLVGKNLSITAVGDALANQATTTMIDNSSGKMPATKALLKQLYGNNFSTINTYSGTYPADFIILLGADQLTPATTTTTQ